MAFEYQSFATLGVNLNRQKYGPLDVSTVFTSIDDLEYYLTKGTSVSDNVSDYWKNNVPYPYPGQIVALIKSDRDVEIYKLVGNDEGLFDAVALGSGTVDLTGYATITYVEESLSKLDIPVLSEGEILDICK